MKIIDDMKNIIIYHRILIFRRERERETTSFKLKKDLCHLLEDKLYQYIFWLNLERYLVVEY